jgi:hypothetical protein
VQCCARDGFVSIAEYGAQAIEGRGMRMTCKSPRGFGRSPRDVDVDSSTPPTVSIALSSASSAEKRISGTATT